MGGFKQQLEAIAATDLRGCDGSIKELLEKMSISQLRTFLSDWGFGIRGKHTKAELIENIDTLSKISSELKPLPEAQGVGFRWCGGPRIPQRACVERTTAAREGGASRTEAVLGNL